MQMERPLGFTETILALLHEKTAGTALITCVGEVEGKIDFLFFIQGLKYLWNCYPILSAKIISSNQGYSIKQNVNFEQIPVRFLQLEDPTVWQEIMHQEINTALPPSQYLWRATLISAKNQLHHYIVITIHHSISDALSAVVILDALIRYFNYPEIKSKVVEFPAPVEKIYMPREKSIAIRDDKIAPEWLHESTVPFTKRESCFKYGRISAADLEKIKLLSKKNMVSINSILIAALLFSVRKIQQKNTGFQLTTPVNLRAVNSNNLINEIAYLCGNVHTYHSIKEIIDFWQLAKNYQQRLRDQIKNLHLQVDFEFSALKKLLEIVFNPSRNFFCKDLLVSNLGILNFNNTSNYKVKSFYPGLNGCAGDYGLIVAICSLPDHLLMTIGYCSPLISQEWITQFSITFKMIVKEYLKINVDFIN